VERLFGGNGTPATTVVIFFGDQAVDQLRLGTGDGVGVGGWTGDGPEADENGDAADEDPGLVGREAAERLDGSGEHAPEAASIGIDGRSPDTGQLRRQVPGPVFEDLPSPCRVDRQVEGAEVRRSVGGSIAAAPQAAAARASARTQPGDVPSSTARATSSAEGLSIRQRDGPATASPNCS
jgi:hypothetical protein